MLFYGTYARDVVRKATIECGCCMTNEDIMLFYIPRETLEMDM